MSITPEDEGIGEFLKRLRAATERMTTLNDEAKQLDRTIADRKADWEARMSSAPGDRRARGERGVRPG